MPDRRQACHGLRELLDRSQGTPRWIKTNDSYVRSVVKEVLRTVQFTVSRLMDVCYHGAVRMKDEHGKV